MKVKPIDLIFKTFTLNLWFLHTSNVSYKITIRLIFFWEWQCLCLNMISDSKIEFKSFIHFCFHLKFYCIQVSLKAEKQIILNSLKVISIPVWNSDVLFKLYIKLLLSNNNVFSLQNKYCIIYSLNFLGQFGTSGDFSSWQA